MQSIEILNKIIDVQEDRAKEYNSNGLPERSFSRVAKIFNAYRDTKLQPSDIALLMEILKFVRADDAPTPHEDSYIDKPSYATLWSELHYKEKQDELTKKDIFL